MNKKSFMIFVLILLVLPIFASAQSSSGTGLLGGVDSEILKTVINIINYPIPIVYSYISDGRIEGTTPLWLLLAVFAIVYSVIWIASGFVKLFKDDENRNVRIIFSIAVTIITIFFTPVLGWIVALISLFTTLSYIALLILGIFIIWTLFKSGWASGAAMNAESKQSLAQAAQLSAEAGRQKDQTKEYARKTNMAKKNGVRKQKSLISGLRKDLTTILNDLLSIRKGKHYSMLGTNREKRVLNDLSKISKDLGAIISFKTENDRIMSGMSSSNYWPKDNAGLAGSTVSRTILDKEKELSTETNDLGRVISGIAQEVKTNGIVSGRPPDNLGKLISMTENAVNIATRMERDVVLEDQLLDKM